MKRFSIAWVLLAGALSAPGQAAAPGVLSAHLVPGQMERYEFEGAVHFAAGRAPGVKLNILDDCAYRLHAIIRIEPKEILSEGTLQGQVRFEDVHFTEWDCANAPRPELVEALHKLAEGGTEFQINPAGDVHQEHFAKSDAQYEGVHLLLKAAWDLVQTRLSDGPVAPASQWTKSRRFLYWPDTFVDDLDVAAASMQYKRDVKVAGRGQAWLEYKQVFSPEELPAFVEPRSRARDFTGTNFVIGGASVSVLLDRGQQRIAYVHYQRTIDNRLTLKYAQEEAEPVAKYLVEEESTTRWLPPSDSQAWLAQLHRFERDEMAPAATAKMTGDGTSLGEVASAARRKKTSGAKEEHDLYDLIDRAPKGFERWRRSYCSGPYCMELSLAVPSGARVVDTTDATSLLVSGAGRQAITIAVGPVLDRQYQGLSDEELLDRQSKDFVAHYLWPAAGPGRTLNYVESSANDRPAGFSDFSAKFRDLTPSRGRLVLVIGPSDRLVPVVCSYAASSEEEMDSTCQTVTESVTLH
jgi:hypothetical protein